MNKFKKVYEYSDVRTLHVASIVCLFLALHTVIIASLISIKLSIVFAIIWFVMYIIVSHICHVEISYEKLEKELRDMKGDGK